MVYHFLRSDNFVAQLSSDWGIGLFIALAVIPFGTAYYLFRKFINPINKNLMAANSTSSYFRLSYSVLKFAFFSNAAFLTIITVQIISVSEFNLGITILSLQANSVLVTILFTYLSYKFLSWFKSSHDLAVLFLGLAFAFIAIGTAATDAAQTTFFLLDNPARIEESASSQGISYDPSVNLKSDPLLHDIFLAIQFPLRIAFVFYWLATVMLLRKYSKSMGKLRFWSLVTLPLATFIIASIFIYSGIGSVLLRGIISSTTTLVAGILFGVIFLTIARALGSTRPQKEKDKQLDRGRTVSQYLMMSVFGSILFLVVSTPPNHIIDWVHVPFPPFADVVWMFMGFAAYLYSFGLTSLQSPYLMMYNCENRFNNSVRPKHPCCTG